MMRQNEIEREQEIRVKVWATYHDIQALEDLGFAPIGYPPMNPEDTTDDLKGLSNVYEYNNAIVLMKFGPSDSVLTARPCEEEITVKINAKEYMMPRAYLHCGEHADICIDKWIKENVM